MSIAATQPATHRRFGLRSHVATGLAVATVLACLLGVEPTASAGPTTGLSDDPEAVNLLARAASAGADVSYTGAQTVTVFSGSRSVTAMVQLTHVAGTGTVVQPAGSAYRPVTSTYLPVADAGATLRRASLTALVDAYEVTVSSKPAWPVGRRAQVVVLRRPDGGIAARLWVDDMTGLLLRRQVYGDDGQLVRASVFTDLRLVDEAALPGGDADMVALTGRMAVPQSPTTGQPTTTEAAVTAAQARAAGWHVPDELVPGAQLLGATSANGGEVLHLVYTDGLTSLSVFQQQGRLDPTDLDAAAATVAGHRVYLHTGLPSYAVWSCEGITYTAVADTPDQLAAAVAALPHSADQHGGLLARIGRGMHRLYGILDPLA